MRRRTVSTNEKTLLIAIIAIGLCSFIREYVYRWCDALTPVIVIIMLICAFKGLLICRKNGVQYSTDRIGTIVKLILGAVVAMIYLGKVHGDGSIILNGALTANFTTFAAGFVFAAFEAAVLISMLTFRNDGEGK